MVGHLGHGGAQALRVLLGDQHRQAHDAGRLHQRRGAAGDVVEPVDAGPEGLLDVDDHDRGPVALEHQLTAPIANERSRKATAPAATVIRTRPVSVRPWKAQLAERLS